MPRCPDEASFARSGIAAIGCWGIGACACGLGLACGACAAGGVFGAGCVIGAAVGAWVAAGGGVFGLCCAQTGAVIARTAPIATPPSRCFIELASAGFGSPPRTTASLCDER